MNLILKCSHPHRLAILITYLFSFPVMASEYSECVQRLPHILGHQPSKKEMRQACKNLSDSPHQVLGILEGVRKATRALKPVELDCDTKDCETPFYTYETPETPGSWWSSVSSFFDGKKFLKEDVPGDGDCGFTAMDIPRAKMKKELQNRLDNGSRTEAKEVARFLTLAYDAERERIDQGGYASSEVKREMQKLRDLPRKERPRRFLRRIFPRKDFYANLPIIELASSVFKKNILIVKSTGEAKKIMLSLGTQSAFIKPGNLETRYLFHNGVNHFDRIVETTPEDDAQRMARKAKKRRARQIKQDEALARKLQEQEYEMDP